MVDVPQPGRAGPSPDDAGFREWVAVRSTALRRKAYLLCGDWHAADDLVQEALVAIYPKWSRIARGSSVDAYANRVLIGKFVDARRRPWRRERPVHDVPDAADPRAQRGFTEIDDHDGPLTAALATIPATQRAVLVLRFTDDLSVEEIDHVLGLPAGTVKSRLSRGTESLRVHLAPRGDLDARARPVTPLVPVTEDLS